MSCEVHWCKRTGKTLNGVCVAMMMRLWTEPFISFSISAQENDNEKKYIHKVFSLSMAEFLFFGGRFSCYQHSDLTVLYLHAITLGNQVNCCNAV